jgi:hypothetical protein
MGKSMENILEEKKQKIKNQIKNFFETNNIPYREEKNKISEKIVIEGKIFIVNLLQYGEIDIHIDKDKFLTVVNKEKAIEIICYEAFPKEYRSELKIPKTNLEIALSGIYYYNNKLVFLF